MVTGWLRKRRHAQRKGRRAAFVDGTCVGFWVPNRDPDYGDVYREVGPALSPPPRGEGEQRHAGKRVWTFVPIGES